MKEKATTKHPAKLRKALKKRKPMFRRHESWRYKRLKESWRKPRGLDNKMRFGVKGWPKSVNIGYGGSKTARALHPSGYQEVLVHTPDEVVSVDPMAQAIRIAHTVGMRKRIQIASLAREREIHVLNPLVGKEVEEETVEEVAEEVPPEPEKPKEKPKKKSKRSKHPKTSKGVRTNES